ncbi:uncharacterized protein LOC106349786 [Brassica napus]|uniref:uncharacterized protein LOC106349786 n=1 Tax=Brassica napus TaxID=3708 RepID=UPI00207912D9|nr:uncharacterized protein LOC106349786 [Brassica napus]
MGEAGGYFKSSRGLRQEDPLSPYLFVLAMEVFSRLLKSRYASGYIEYHPNAKPVDISHLMFADDVMVFYDGSSSSLHGISETLDDFAMWSGLEINQTKSKLFTAGLTHQETITSMSYGFPIGTLPIRYLGLPLMHRKLRISEYSPLLDKIAGNFNAWHGGVLDHNVHLAKGLYQEYKISLLKVPMVRDSWHLKSLLKLRQLSRPFIVCTVQNGRSANFWFDQWTPLGALIDALGPSGPRALRIPLQATVSEATTDDLWNLPVPRSDEAVALHAYLTTIPATDALQISGLGNAHSNHMLLVHLLNWPSTAPVRPLRILRSVAVQEIVYNLWAERNNRIFKNKVLTTSELFKILDRQVRNTISARKTRKHFKNLMAVWLF